MNIKDIENIMHEKLTEDELKKIEYTWESLDYIDSDTQRAKVMYIKLKQRIHKAKLRRMRIRVTSAAAVVLVSLATWYFTIGMEHNSKTLAFDYKETGVSKPQNGVVLQIDGENVDIDEKLVSIDKSDDDKNINITTENGKKLKEVASDKKIVVKVPVGHQFELVLSDGTKVWLNSDTEFTYTASFTGKERRVKLSGEGYFDVTKDASKPFIVSVDGRYDIKVLGTQFNVNSYRGVDISSTTLIEGKVMVMFKGDGDVVEMKPNQQVSVDNKYCVDIKDVDVAPMIAWKNKQFLFDNEELDNIAVKLERCYGIKVNVAGQYSNMRFSGRVTYNRGIEYFIRVLKETAGIDCRLIDGELFIGNI